uniref:Uncharacterized protein n=1 Tax=Oncorhynchus tshawytscha TaxID=74940 RepID=A0A8C8G4S4_ONCTS
DINKGPPDRGQTVAALHTRKDESLWCKNRSTLDEDNRMSLNLLSPVSSKRGMDRMKFLLSPWKLTRKITKIPFKVLDAPELQDDFYLNLVDWSALMVLSKLRHLSISGVPVHFYTSPQMCIDLFFQVTHLCDLAVEGDSVTSVGWGNHVTVGTHKGYVQIWDAAAGKKLFTLEGHTARNADQLPSGSRDLMILQMIQHIPLQSERRLQESHKDGGAKNCVYFVTRKQLKLDHEQIFFFVINVFIQFFFSIIVQFNLQF